MATYFSVCLSDPAREFVLVNVKPGMTFEEIEELIVSEYNSTSRQLQVRRKLESLRIPSIIAEEGFTSKEVVLTEAINAIESLEPH